MKPPVFSVCLLAWRSEAYVCTAARSLLGQDFTDWECVIADDCSGDGSREALAEYLADPRFLWHTNTRNLGQAVNWAAAISRCRGRYIATLHADDAYEPGALTAFHGAFGKGADFVWGNWEYRDENLERFLRAAPVRDRSFDGKESLEWLVENNHALPSATAFASELVGRAGLPDEGCGIFCDREYFLRLAAHSTRAIAIGQVVTRYRQHVSSTTSDSFVSGRFQADMMGLAGRVRLNATDASRGFVAELERQSAESVLLSAFDALLRGRPAFAVRWMREAVALSGVRLLRPSLLIGLARVAKVRILGQ